MKHLTKILFTLLLIVSINTFSQDTNSPWSLSFGVNAIDSRASAGGNKSILNNIFSNAFEVKQNWNIIPSLSYIGVSRYIGDNFSLGVQGSYNKIEKFVIYDKKTNQYSTINPGSLNYYSLDGFTKFSFMKLIKSKMLDPNASLGAGYTLLGKNGFGTFNVGLGLSIWLSENIALSLNTTAKKAIGNDRVDSNLKPDKVSHIQHTLGFTYKFGGKDMDGDGINDKKDACVDVFGTKEFNGCPDTDGDKIIDKEDECKDVAGLKLFNGCPDTDSDGVADKEDECPQEAGLVFLKGCPDTDDDGIANKDDKCENEKGFKENNGCPWPDTDGDGVIDKDDSCPKFAGSVSNKGCPVVPDETVGDLKMHARRIFFNPGKSTFKEEDVPSRLDAMGDVIKNYPNSKFVIEGHTDSDGSEELNQELSEERANAVKEVLVQRGANPNDITTIGFGETKPIATNKTKEGKAKNRRTEIKLVK